MDILIYLQSGPQKYAIIFCIVYVIVMIPVVIWLFNKRKKKAEAFRSRNREAAIIQILTKAAKEDVASSITVKTVNGENPIFTGASGKQFYVLPGTNKIHVKAEWSEFSLLARGKSKYLSTDATIEITAKANETYNLKYNIKDQQFVIEKLDD